MVIPPHTGGGHAMFEKNNNLEHAYSCIFLNFDTIFGIFYA